MSTQTIERPSLTCGTTYAIGRNGLGVAVFHSEGEVPIHSHHVVGANITLSLSNIPSDLQEALSIGDSEIVTTAGPVDGTAHAIIVLENGNRIPLSHFFGRGVRVVLAEG